MKLEQIREQSSACKPTGADIEWAELSRAYADQSRSTTASRLRTAGVGLKDNAYPLDMGGLLRQVIDRATTVYKRAPARWLVDPGTGKRLAEDSLAHLAMLDAFEKAQYDTTWRKVDRLRTLLGQCVLRFYPSDPRGSVVMRVFEPHQVHRVPDPACSDLLDHDRALALELSAGTFEVWERSGSGAWTMQWVDSDGRPLPSDQQPFAVTGLANPYGVLPVMQVYSEHPGGAPWIAPRQGRLGWLHGMALAANDALALAVFQAHATRVFKRSGNQNRTLPKETGPGVVLNIDKEEDVEDLIPSPAIDKLLDLLGRYGRIFSTTESLPGDELDPNKTVQTGAALRAQLAPLIDVRENQVALVGPDERMAFTKFRAVYNVHAPNWGVPALDPTHLLELEVPDLETPATETELGNLAARQLAIGTASTIDLIQREIGCTRAEAIKRYQRVAEDNRLYPSRAAALTASLTTGPKLADSPGPGPTAPDLSPDAVLDGKASVIDAIAGGADGGAL